MFELWRQDDHGHRFLVGRFAERAEAERKLADLSRGLHKQTYWITTEPASGPRQDR